MLSTLRYKLRGQEPPPSYFMISDVESENDGLDPLIEMKSDPSGKPWYQACMSCPLHQTFQECLLPGQKQRENADDDSMMSMESFYRFEETVEHSKYPLQSAFEQASLSSISSSEDSWCDEKDEWINDKEENLQSPTFIERPLGLLGVAFPHPVVTGKMPQQWWMKQSDYEWELIGAAKQKDRQVWPMQAACPRNEERAWWMDEGAPFDETKSNETPSRHGLKLGDGQKSLSYWQNEQASLHVEVGNFDQACPFDEVSSDLLSQASGKRMEI